MIVNSDSRVVRILVMVYALLYTVMFLLDPLTADKPMSQIFSSNAEMITVFGALALFITGATVMWFNEKWGGIIIMIWHFLVWVFALTIWPEAGMVLILIFLMLIPAAILIRNWYVANDEAFSDKTKQWRLALNILLYNYAAIFLMTAIVDILPRISSVSYVSNVDELQSWDYSSPLGLAIIALAIIFALGVFLSKSHIRTAGIVFILWYVLMSVLTFIDPVFSNSGPHMLFGSTILIHGILFLKLHKMMNREKVA